jgi:hypothetical protein
MERSGELARTYREAQLVAWAFMATVAVHAAIVEFFLLKGETFTGFHPEKVAAHKDYFILGGVLAFVIIRAVRTSILRGESTDTLGTLLGRLKTANMVVYAIAEVPAILGLVLFLFTGDRKDFYLLAVFSILAMILYYPKLNHWEVWLRKQE